MSAFFLIILLRLGTVTLNKENLYAVTGRLILNPLHHYGQLIFPGYLFIANKTTCKFCSLFALNPPLNRQSKAGKVYREKFITYSLLRLLTHQQEKIKRLGKEGSCFQGQTLLHQNTCHQLFLTIKQLKLPAMLSTLLGEGYFNHSIKWHTHGSFKR